MAEHARHSRMQELSDHCIHNTSLPGPKTCVHPHERESCSPYVVLAIPSSSFSSSLSRWRATYRAAGDRISLTCQADQYPQPDPLPPSLWLSQGEKENTRSEACLFEMSHVILIGPPPPPLQIPPAAAGTCGFPASAVHQYSRGGCYGNDGNGDTHTYININIIGFKAGALPPWRLS